MKHVKAQKNQRKKAVKKQVAKLAMKKKEPKADTATLNRHLLRLMDKPWKSCSPEEQMGHLGVLASAEPHRVQPLPLEHEDQ